VIYMLHGMGMSTGVDLDQLVSTSAWLAGQLGKETSSRVTRARTAR
jgi:hydroxymethylglutaryl-CoA lyase